MDEKTMAKRHPSIAARVEGGRRLVVLFNDGPARTAFEEIVNAAAATNSTTALDVLPFVSDEEGPNARGTYSKAYVARHPEIEWVHRGQGRYLPAAQARVVAAPSLTE